MPDAMPDVEAGIRTLAVPCRAGWRNRARSLAMTQPPATLTRSTLKTPRAAAIAGILFSVLVLATFLLLHMAVPADPLESGAWLGGRSGAVTIGLNLVPFAGVAFLWFIGVVRDRLGEREDRFFATVFFGSGLLFLATLFAAAAVIGALMLAFEAAPQLLVGSATFHFGRALAYSLVNVYMIKVAGVFLITASTVAMYTDFAPRRIAILGYVAALVLIFGSFYVDWAFVVFPLWVLLVSLHILLDNLRPRASDGPSDPPQ
jgi:hypothetical protein